MIRESQTFGSRLRAERERRGIALDSIAEQTKIKKSFLEGLERGDFSKWPAGTVFRRAYVRDYAAAIGLPPDSVVMDFNRLYPVDEPTVAPSVLTLTFDRAPAWQLRLAARRARVAAFDVLGVLVVATILALLTGTRIWVVAGAVAFVYYPATYALWGRTLAARGFEARISRRRVDTASSPSRPVTQTTPPISPKPAARLVPVTINRPTVVVDPLLLTVASRSAPAVPHETTAH